jgi:hypothetical protein
MAEPLLHGSTEAAEAAALELPDDALAIAFGPLSEALPAPDSAAAPEGPSPDRSDGFGPAGRYQVQGELARGGMGVILLGRDRDLGRELAIKILREDHRNNAAMARRFVEEAQIGGQLQHPGVVPVYELGRLSDGRPYFSMRLVKGQTLAALLQARPSPADDSMRFLVIFSQVVQTIAYAHSRGVIHRDLKPANIMVGAFGEVQVMDWGLARVLRRRGSEEILSPSTSNDHSPVQTMRTGLPAGETQAGSVLGTPAYMAPEQARGEIDQLDERCDVFGLGAVLCEILTGQPPFTGTSHSEILRQAANGELDEAHARLEGCGADPDLVRLARACLAADPAARPGNAGLVADGVSVYFARVEKRMRAAELAEAQAQAASTLIAAMAARESSSGGSRPAGVEAPAPVLAALEEALARAGLAPVADQLVLYRAATAEILRQAASNAFVRDVLHKALADSAGLEDPYHAAWLLRGALDEARGLLSFRPLPEAARTDEWPEFTPVGAVQLQHYPAYRRARTRVSRDLDTAFWALLNHITRHNIPMTAPVEITLERLDGSPARQQAMAFLYPSDRLGHPGQEGDVAVEDVPPGMAVSIGLLGEPSDRWFGQARAALAEWLEEHAGEYEPVGPPRLLSYNSPMVPPGRRYSEVQVPVRILAQGPSLDRHHHGFVGERASVARADADLE